MYDVCRLCFGRTIRAVIAQSYTMPPNSIILYRGIKNRCLSVLSNVIPFRTACLAASKSFSTDLHPLFATGQTEHLEIATATILVPFPFCFTLTLRHHIDPDLSLTAVAGESNQRAHAAHIQRCLPRVVERYRQTSSIDPRSTPLWSASHL